MSIVDDIERCFAAADNLGRSRLLDQGALDAADRRRLERDLRVRRRARHAAVTWALAALGDANRRVAGTSTPPWSIAYEVMHRHPLRADMDRSEVRWARVPEVPAGENPQQRTFAAIPPSVMWSTYATPRRVICNQSSPKIVAMIGVTADRIA